MKVLWIENQKPVRDLLSATAEKVARSRLPVDLVIASSLMQGEHRLRLERFDLVILDLILPDSTDADMTIARIASMGKHRITICSARDERDTIAQNAREHGANITPKAIHKETLPFNRFMHRTTSFHAFLLDQMPLVQNMVSTTS